MKNIYSLIIIISLIISTKSPFGWDFNWNWDFNWDWDFKWKDFINKFKTSVPEFISNMQNKIKDFMDKTEEARNNYIKELNITISELNKKIKQDIIDQKENIETQIKSLIEKTTEASKFLSYKVCDTANLNYKECRNDKKKLFTNLIDVVKENFGECSIIIGQLSNLTDNPEQNLKYFLFMMISLSENPDALEEGKSQIIYDILNCLLDKLDQFWPEISRSISDNKTRINTKQDIINLLLNTLSNLVNVVYFQDMDGYIKDSNETTGLISDPNAKQIYKNIFNISKRFNEFGSNFYNISANLGLNVFLNSGKLNIENDNEINWIIDENKGIKINLHTNYLLRDNKAYSVQAVIFDSPLVSLRGKKENENGISNIFVGITLYDKDGNEIFVHDIDLEKYRPIIYFKENLYKAMRTCLYYNEDKDTVEDSGINTKFEIINGEKYLKCIPEHLSSFTIGTFNTGNATSETEEVSNNENINDDTKYITNKASSNHNANNDGISDKLNNGQHNDNGDNNDNENINDINNDISNTITNIDDDSNKENNNKNKANESINGKTNSGTNTNINIYININKLLILILLLLI